MQKIFFVIFISPFIISSLIFSSPFPQNIILLIGDGMGPVQLEAASIFQTGTKNGLFIQSLPYKGKISVHSAGGNITDSAASATAMATGKKVSNGVLSYDHGKPLETILEYCQKQGKKTGLVTTTLIYDATPAAFASHVVSRNKRSEIAHFEFRVIKPDILMGGCRPKFFAWAKESDYTIVTNRNELFELVQRRPIDRLRVLGAFKKTHLPYEFDGVKDKPHLREMAGAALSFLENSSKGFFLMIESGRIDHASHANEIKTDL